MKNLHAETLLYGLAFLGILLQPTKVDAETKKDVRIDVEACSFQACDKPLPVNIDTRGSGIFDTFSPSVQAEQGGAKASVRGNGTVSAGEITLKMNAESSISDPGHESATATAQGGRLGLSDSIVLKAPPPMPPDTPLYYLVSHPLTAAGPLSGGATVGTTAIVSLREGTPLDDVSSGRVIVTKLSSAGKEVELFPIGEVPPRRADMGFIIGGVDGNRLSVSSVLVFDDISSLNGRGNSSADVKSQLLIKPINGGTYTSDGGGNYGQPASKGEVGNVLQEQSKGSTVGESIHAVENEKGVSGAKDVGIWQAIKQAVKALELDKLKQLFNDPPDPIYTVKATPRPLILPDVNVNGDAELGALLNTSIDKMAERTGYLTAASESLNRLSTARLAGDLSSEQLQQQSLAEFLKSYGAPIQRNCGSGGSNRHITARDGF
jgi:hypothetical protein